MNISYFGQKVVTDTVNRVESISALLTLIVIALAAFVAIVALINAYRKTPKVVTATTLALIAIASLAMLFISPDSVMPALQQGISTTLIHGMSVTSWIQSLVGSASRLFG